jgi:hypothetical protein
LRALLGLGDRNFSFLGGRVLFLDDRQRQFREMLQLELLLFPQPRRQFARVEKCTPQQPQKAEADEDIDLSADGHFESTFQRMRHDESPLG